MWTAYYKPVDEHGLAHLTVTISLGSRSSHHIYNIWRQGSGRLHNFHSITQIESGRCRIWSCIYPIPLHGLLQAVGIKPFLMLPGKIYEKVLGLSWGKQKEPGSINLWRPSALPTLHLGCRCSAWLLVAPSSRWREGGLLCGLGSALFKRTFFKVKCWMECVTFHL